MMWSIHDLNHFMRKIFGNHDEFKVSWVKLFSMMILQNMIIHHSNQNNLKVQIIDQISTKPRSEVRKKLNMCISQIESSLLMIRSKKWESSSIFQTQRLKLSTGFSRKIICLKTWSKKFLISNGKRNEKDLSKLLKMHQKPLKWKSRRLLRNSFLKTFEGLGRIRRKLKEPNEILNH